MSGSDTKCPTGGGPGHETEELTDFSDKIMPLESVHACTRPQGAATGPAPGARHQAVSWVPRSSGSTNSLFRASSAIHAGTCQPVRNMPTRRSPVTGSGQAAGWACFACCAVVPAVHMASTMFRLSWQHLISGTRLGATGALAGMQPAVRASDPKVGTGFGKNPMLKQRDRAAAPIPSMRPPL